jgi:hypothetical protein
MARLLDVEGSYQHRRRAMRTKSLDQRLATWRVGVGVSSFRSPSSSRVALSPRDAKYDTSAAPAPRELEILTGWVFVNATGCAADRHVVGYM